MRKLLLASSALFLLGAGAALAQPPGPPPPSGGSSTKTTTVAVAVPIKNANSSGTGNASATTGGEAKSLSNVGNTTSSDNTANSHNLSVFASLNNVGNRSLAITHTDTHIDVKLATSSNNGEVDAPLFVINNPTGSRDGRDRSSSGSGSLTGSAEMHDVNGGSGIMNAAQNTGLNSLQQNSVALSSVVNAGGNGTGISGF